MGSTRSYRWLIVSSVVALACALTPASAAALAVAPGTAILAPRDLAAPGVSVDHESPSRFIRLLPAATRRAIHGHAAQDIMIVGGAGVRLVSRAFVFATAGAARSEHGAIEHASAKADPAALKVTAKQAKSATRRFWHLGTTVGELVLLDPHRQIGRTALSVLVHQLQARISVEQATGQWEGLQSQIAHRAHPTRRQALEGFSLVIARLPGVRAPLQSSGPVDSGTPAIAWILRYRTSITGAQRRIVDRVLAARPHAGDRASVAAGGLPGYAPGQRLVPAILAYYSRSLGVPLSVPVTVVLGQADNVRTPAFTESFDAQGEFSGPQASCLITVNRFAAALSPELDFVMAHEVFHCVQAELSRNLAEYYAKEDQFDWLIEGGANWAACTYTQAPSAINHFRRYLATPNTSLFDRSYDAVGYFGLLAQSGLRPFTPMEEALNSSTPVEAYQAFVGGSEPDVLERWGSIPYFQDRRGPDWRADPVGCAPTDVTLTPAPLKVTSDGKPTRVAGFKLASYQFALSDPAPDIFEVRVGGGDVRVNGGGADVQTTTSDDDTFYCTLKNKCPCPPGQDYAGPELHQVHGDPQPTEIATAAGLEPMNAALYGFTLKRFQRQYCGGKATVTYTGTLDTTIEMTTRDSFGNQVVAETLTQNRVWSLRWSGPVSSVTNSSGESVPWTSQSVSGSESDMKNISNETACSDSISASPGDTFSAILVDSSTASFDFHVPNIVQGNCKGVIPGILGCPPGNEVGSWCFPTRRWSIRGGKRTFDVSSDYGPVDQGPMIVSSHLHSTITIS